MCVVEMCGDKKSLVRSTRLFVVDASAGQMSWPEHFSSFLVTLSAQKPPTPRHPRRLLLHQHQSLISNSTIQSHWRTAVQHRRVITIQVATVDRLLLFFFWSHALCKLVTPLYLRHVVDRPKL